MLMQIKSTQIFITAVNCNELCTCLHFNSVLQPFVFIVLHPDVYIALEPSDFLIYTCTPTVLHVCSSWPLENTLLILLNHFSFLSQSPLCLHLSFPYLPTESHLCIGGELETAGHPRGIK